MNLEHEFQIALVKSQASECQDIEAMRKLVLQACELLEVQRQWLKDQLGTRRGGLD